MRSISVGEANKKPGVRAAAASTASFESSVAFSLATFITPSATDVVTSSVAVSTPSRSNHSRALLAAMSALFWWSAETSSTLKAGFSLATKSSMAICVAITVPLPDTSE